MPIANSKPVWVMTGVSRGIGRALAQLLVARFDVVALVRKPTGLPIMEIECDLASPLTEHALSQLDAVLDGRRVRGFLHCAGVLGLPQQPSLFSLPPTQEAMHVNAFSAMEIIERLIPVFRKSCNNSVPCVMHLSTGAAFSPYVGLENYCISKSAALMYFRTLAARFSSAELSVLSIAPGVTDTDMLSQIMTLDSSVLTSKDWFLEATKTGLVHSANEIASIIAHIILESQTNRAEIHGKLLDFLHLNEPQLYSLHNEAPRAWLARKREDVTD